MIVCRRRGNSRVFNFNVIDKEIDQNITKEFSEKVIMALGLISDSEESINLIKNSSSNFVLAKKEKEDKDFYIYELKTTHELYEKIEKDFTNKDENPCYISNIFDTFNIAFDVFRKINDSGDNKDPNIWYITIQDETEKFDEDESNNLFFEFKQNGNYPKNGINFKSYTEKVIFEELLKHNLLIIPIPTVILGTADCHKEPDFMILHKNKLGILEVCGEKFHKTEKDHERRRLFINWGIKTVEFYDASECYNNPKQVVESFLKILKNS